jgi:hypothetical protein
VPRIIETIISPPITLLIGGDLPLNSRAKNKEITGYAYSVGTNRIIKASVGCRCLAVARNQDRRFPSDHLKYAQVVELILRRGWASCVFASRVPGDDNTEVTVYFHQLIHKSIDRHFPWNAIQIAIPSSPLSKDSKS